MMRTAMDESIFSMPFFQNALIGGTLIVLMLSVLSFFVVLRKISFIGVGISHSALGGVALGLVLGTNITLTTTLFCVAIAILIGMISRRTGGREDAAIGITFSGSMALGIVLISLSHSQGLSLFSYLFGSILSITRLDIYIIAFYCIATLLLISSLFKPLLHASFDEEVAQVRGIPVHFLRYLLLILISLAIVASIKLVGIILVASLLVLPAATAFQIARTYRAIVVLAVGFGLIALFSGLTVSYKYDLPSGPSIVLTACAIFVVCFAASPWRRSRRNRGG